MPQSRHLWTLVFLWLAGAGTARAGRPWEVRRSHPAVESFGTAAGASGEDDVACQDAFGRGRESLRQGRYDRARRELTETVVRCPTLLAARLLRARATLVIGFLGWRRDLIEECAGDVTLARSLDPDNRDAAELSILIEGLLRRMKPAAP